MKRLKRDSLTFNLINNSVVVILTVIFLYPMWHIIMASFSKPINLINQIGLMGFPLGFSLDGYKAVIRNPNIMTGYGNTIFYVVLGTVLNVLMTVLGAYVLSRKNFLLKKPLTLLIVMTMYINAGMIPNFLLIKYLGLYNSRMALILPGLIGTWNLIVMRTSFNQIPRSLEESALIDGAGEFTILFKIILPVSKATIAVIGLFYAVGHWNAWFSAVIYLRDRIKYPLQLFLREILLIQAAMGNAEGGDSLADLFYLAESIKYCSIVVSTLPILMIYPMVQKYFVTGVMMGSLKE
jgi:putative aldouronate transport system permease protein